MRTLLATFSALAVIAPITMATAAGSASHGVKKHVAKQHLTAKSPPAKKERSRARRVVDHGTVQIRQVGGEIIMEQHGKATYYADSFHGRRTANGARYDRNELTAASNLMPMGTRVKVTNLRNGRSVDVLINDRGPHGGGGRVIDLSLRAAEDLGMRRQGVAMVRIEAKPSEQATANMRERVQELAEAR